MKHIVLIAMLAGVSLSIRIAGAHDGHSAFEPMRAARFDDRSFNPKPPAAPVSGAAVAAVLGLAAVAGVCAIWRKKAAAIPLAAAMTVACSTGLITFGKEQSRAQPDAAKAFEPFSERVKYHWDDRWLYVESNGLPSHDMMVGITAWQQQVPLPRMYAGENAWRIPLHPAPSKNPVSIKGRFLRGAVALAVNGIPIFNPQNNRGEISKEIGELDEWGGHCGRGDDYHYHAAPIFLEKTVGAGNPIAYALDGYPIYGSVGPDHLPVDEKTLDAFHGKTDKQGNYAYYASASYPYINGGFHGEVSEVGGQVDPQPSGRGVRPALPPLQGAKITGFTRSKDDKAFSLKYEVGGETSSVNYQIHDDGLVKFDFIDGRGRARSETYSTPADDKRRGAAREAPPAPAEKIDSRQMPGDRVKGAGTVAFTDNNDGTITDNFTGLIWQKVDNGESTWEKAAANASTLRVAGYDDWRLPTLAELFTLANHNYNPAIDLNFFPSNPTQPAEYWWTSDTRGADRAWVVNRGGGTGAKPKDETISAGGKFSYNARYVRGPRRTIQRHYVNNKDGTVTDEDTGLMWTQAPSQNMSWESAMAYPKGMTIGGHADWRLPDVKELATLIDFSLLNLAEAGGGVSCVDHTLFPNMTAAFYWSSTKLHSKAAGEAWYVDFDTGSVRHQDLSSKGFAIAVRTATPAVSLPVSAHSFFHPEDAPTGQPAFRREREEASGPEIPRKAGRRASGGVTETDTTNDRKSGDAFHLFPRREEEELKLTAEQRKQVEDLAEEVKSKLAKILTPGQLKILEDSRPPRPPGE